jgi:hypothetical protein
LKAFAEIISGFQRCPYVPQGIGVVAEIGAHGGRQGQVLGGSAEIASPGQRQSESELRVVVGGARLDDAAEIAGRGRVLAGVELRPGQCLKYAPGPRLGGSGPLEQLRGGGGTASAKQVETALVKLVGVSTVNRNRIWSIL